MSVSVRLVSLKLLHCLACSTAYIQIIFSDMTMMTTTVCRVAGGYWVPTRCVQCSQDASHQIRHCCSRACTGVVELMLLCRQALVTMHCYTAEQAIEESVVQKMQVRLTVYAVAQKWFFWWPQPPLPMLALLQKPLCPS